MSTVDQCSQISLDTFKLMRIDQPLPHFWEFHHIVQAGLELLILLSQLACPLPSHLFCMCARMCAACVWEGTHDICHSVHSEVREHCGVSSPTFVWVLGVKFKSSDLHSKQPYLPKYLTGSHQLWSADIMDVGHQVRLPMIISFWGEWDEEQLGTPVITNTKVSDNVRDTRYNTKSQIIGCCSLLWYPT